MLCPGCSLLIINIVDTCDASAHHAALLKLHHSPACTAQVGPLGVAARAIPCVAIKPPCITAGGRVSPAESLAYEGVGGGDSEVSRAAVTVIHDWNISAAKYSQDVLFICTPASPATRISFYHPAHADLEN